MNNELELALVTKISETYSESVTLADQTREMAKKAIQKAIECGHYLIEAKTMVGHGGWLGWFTANTAHVRNFSIDTAQRYMRLAITPPEELKDAYSMRQAYIAAGILDKNSSRSEAINRDPDGTNWISALDKLTIRVEHLFDARPLNQWDEDEKELFVERTRPVVKRFVAAGGKL